MPSAFVTPMEPSRIGFSPQARSSTRASAPRNGETRRIHSSAPGRRSRVDACRDSAAASADSSPSFQRASNARAFFCASAVMNAPVIWCRCVRAAFSASFGFLYRGKSSINTRRTVSGHTSRRFFAESSASSAACARSSIAYILHTTRGFVALVPARKQCPRLFLRVRRHERAGDLVQMRARRLLRVFRFSVSRQKLRV